MPMIGRFGMTWSSVLGAVRGEACDHLPYGRSWYESFFWLLFGAWFTCSVSVSFLFLFIREFLREVFGVRH